MEGDEFADRTSLSRRGVLGGGLALGLGGLLQACGGSATISRATAVRPAGNDLDAIEHVVFLMMENRSFDHYFGTYPDAKGFDDHPSGSLGPFSQAWATAPAGHVPAGQLLPYRLDPATVSAQCAGDNSKPDHGWISQHESWNMGAMDRFVAAHSELAFDGPDQGPLVMAYMTQADVPFLWALANAYTLCDAFYGSVLGPTMPNRLYYLSGMLDPDGKNGGPIVFTPTAAQAPAAVGSCDWFTAPEALSEKNISWKVYQPADTSVGQLEKINLYLGFNALLYFSQFLKEGTDLYNRAFLPRWPDEFRADIHSGTLPSVSWILPPVVDSTPRPPRTTGSGSSTRSSARSSRIPRSGPRPFCSSLTTRTAGSSITSPRPWPPWARPGNSSPPPPCRLRPVECGGPSGSGSVSRPWSSRRSHAVAP
jgi:phospholipase C